MTVPLIDPKKPLWERLSHALSPQVKAALITVTATIALAFIVSLAENSRLKQENASKTARIQELEIELTPFRTLAVEKFNKANAKTLKKLAETMTALQRDYSQSLNTITSLQAQLEVVRKRQQPRGITGEDRKKLIASMQSKLVSEVTIVWASGDGEATLFAKELARVFQEAGVPHFTTPWTGTPLPAGVSLLSRNELSDGSASVLRDALQSAGIQLQYARGAMIPGKDIQLLVGFKQ